MKGARRAPGRAGFLQPDGVAQQRNATDHREQQKYVMEVDVLADEAAHHRANHRPQRHHHLERAHRPNTLGAFEPIPDHRHCHHRTGSDTHCLQRTKHQQRLDIG